MVGLKVLGSQIYKVSVFSSTAGHGPCQNLLEIKPAFLLYLTKSCQPIPWDLYYSTTFREYDIVNSDGLLLKYLLWYLWY